MWRYRTPHGCRCTRGERSKDAKPPGAKTRRGNEEDWLFDIVSRGGTRRFVLILRSVHAQAVPQSRTRVRARAPCFLACYLQGRVQLERVERSGRSRSGAIVVFKLNAPTSAPVEAANFAALGYRERFTVRCKHCYTRTASILRECDTAHTSLLTLSLKSRQGKKECRVGIRETRH